MTRSTSRVKSRYTELPTTTPMVMAKSSSIRVSPSLLRPTYAGQLPDVFLPDGNPVRQGGQQPVDGAANGEGDTEGTQRGRRQLHLTPASHVPMANAMRQERLIDPSPGQPDRGHEQ